MCGCHGRNYREDHAESTAHRRTILNGAATGKGADNIVRDMGKVIVHKDSFRQAGSRVFNKAQYRKFSR